MSRIIVKNLPGRISESRLKDLFSTCGDITDVKLVKTQSGVFRRFAFVGYALDTQAQEAVKHFNKTFVNSSKIEVEIAKPYKDESLSRPWSKYSKGSSAFDKQKTVKRKSDKRDAKEERGGDDSVWKSKLGEMMRECSELEADPSFQEFLETHKHKSKTKLWADGLAGSGKVKGHDKEEESKTSAPVDEGINEENDTLAVSTETSDMDYLRSKIVPTDVLRPQSASSDSSDTESDSHSSTSSEDEAPPTQLGSTPFTVKMLGLPFSVKEKEICEFFHPIPVVSVRFTTDPQGRPSGRGYVDFQCEDDIQRALKRNKDCIRHRYIELFRDDLPQATVKEETVVSNRPWERTTETNEIEDVSESGRLFVRNLSYSTSEDDLTKLFEKFGPLTEVTIPLDKHTNKSTGIAFVTFMLPEHAVRAYDSLDGQIVQGRLLHILPAKPRNSRDEGETKAGSSFKNKKQQKAKSEAGKGHNWNTLFLGPNAIVDAIADRYSVDKSSVLDPTSEGSAAVRVALGETQLVAETRTFLESKGVHLEMFGDEKLKRSKTIILVKNLPYGTTEVEIGQLFEPFGQLSQIILPPAGISALVEFAESAHARNAFQKLAYTSFKHLPLYLEWAPSAVIDKKVAERASEAKSEDDPTVQEDATVFVKNLNFSTREDALRSLMARAGRVKSVSIAKKLNMKDPSKPLSMGYGFVEFTTRKAALKAIKNLQHSDLDGHKLELKVSTRETKTVDQTRKSAKKSEQPSSKILVRNVPFEASKREIRDLFQTFGQLKTARLPKKFGSSQSEHRGFGFVEFVTKEDAKRAFDSLCQSTHLYGRRLVLEWAEQEESVEAIRKRTAEHFHGFKLPGAKQSKSGQQTLLDSLDRLVE